MSFGAFDTEDNSAELLAAGKSGFDKQVTRICAVDANGKWYLSPAGHPDPVPAFKSWLAQRKGKWYAHNCKYDLGNLFGDELDELHFSMVGGRFLRAKWRGIVFLDSLNIWPMSLKKIGDAVGLEKLAMDIQGDKYVKRDVEITRKAMRLAYAFADKFKVSKEKFPATLGGLTVKIWSSMGGENWGCSMQLARAAYYGGRVELFSTGGEGRAAYVDVNSMYPWAMTEPFPTAADPWAGLAEGDARSLKGWGVASVTMNIPKCRVAPLPVRRPDGAIYYPWGRVCGVWTLHELRHAIAHGARLVDFAPIGDGCPMIGSQTGHRYYHKYIKIMYALRLGAKTEAEKLFFKLLLNNLYGQLAIRGSVSTTIDIANAINDDGEIDLDGIPFGGKFLTDIEFPLPPHVNYLHAAYVTAYGRLRLMEYMRKIPADDLVYCDTDSVIFWTPDLKRLPFAIGTGLGEMKLEAEIRKCRTVAPKLYQLDKVLADGSTKRETKAKGIPNRKGPDGRWLPEVFIDEKKVAFELPFGLRESITYYDYYKEHGKDGEKSRKLSVWRKVLKQSINTYDKKNLKDGLYYPKRHKNISK